MAQTRLEMVLDKLATQGVLADQAPAALRPLCDTESQLTRELEHVGAGSLGSLQDAEPQDKEHRHSSIAAHSRVAETAQGPIRHTPAATPFARYRGFGHPRSKTMLDSFRGLVVPTDRKQARVECLIPLGARAYLTKPLTPEAVSEVVRKVLGVEGGGE